MSNGAANRRKGHQMERTLATSFRELGWKDCRTTRERDRFLDGLGIDLTGLPFAVQSKSVKSSINYRALIREINQRMKGHGIDLPLVVFHSRGRSNFDKLAVMTEKDFFRLIKILIKEDGKV